MPMFAASDSRRFFHRSLAASRRSFRHAFSALSGASSSGQTPAAQWLLAQEWFLQSQLDEVRVAVSRDYCRRLDRAGMQDGEPRVYRAISGTLRCVVSCAYAADARGKLLTTQALAEVFSPERFGACLTLAELRALPPVVKLVLIERIAALLSGSPLESADCEHDLRSAIECLRSLHRIRWQDLLESISAVHQILSREPSGIYPQMDFESREHYRRAVEELAFESGQSEDAIARATVALAAEAYSADRDSKQAHVGYFLIGGGEARLRDYAQLAPSIRTRLREVILWLPEYFYIGSIVALTAMLTMVAGNITPALSRWWMALLWLPCSQVAVGVVNLATSLVLLPRRIPRLDFSKGIPEDCRTFVVVPTLLLSRPGVERLIERLEIHYLGNRDPRIAFALLTDFPDSASPAPNDDALLQLCANRIRRLNRKYAFTGRAPFYLFHRKQQWNSHQGRWMGRERKRGKIEDFNRLAAGDLAGAEAFEVKVGDLSILPSIRYVITLDTDTQLPLDSAWKLVGTLAHPMQRAVIDPQSGTVREGYAILQPRVSISMESANRSRFAQIFSGQTGLDPYTPAISEIYQDLLGQASFTGKGIYDLHAFRAVLDGRFPDNTLLSHDLIEGEHVRTGLVTDVEVIEAYPSTYGAHRKRKHRWIRGDWQIMQWLLPRVPNVGGEPVSNPLSAISRWKILDNLRRSLFEISMLLMIVASWIIAPAAAARLTITAMGILVTCTYADLLATVFQLPALRFWPQHFSERMGELWRAHKEALLTLATLPDQARVAADAIGRTLVRRFITHRNLLDWESMAEAEEQAGERLDGQTLACIGGLAVVAVIAIGLRGAPWRPVALMMAMWAGSGLMVRFVNAAPSKPERQQRGQVQFLRDIALRTWRYFLDFSRSEDHWLVPDNVREEPESIARRTSPTNIGLQLASNVAAFDFGYLTREELSRRLGDLLDTLQKLNRYRGHFYNWYSTRTLSPIAPRFVSTVDSGNLAAALIAVKQACEGMEKQPLADISVLEGMRDHCVCLRKALPHSARRPAVLLLLGAVIRRLSARPADLFAWKSLLGDLESMLQDLSEHIDSARGTPHDDDPEEWAELRTWQRLLNQRLRAARRGLFDRAPWLTKRYEAELRTCGLDRRFGDLLAALSDTSPAGGIFCSYDGIECSIARLLESGQEREVASSRFLLDLREELGTARAQARALLREFAAHAYAAGRLVQEMDFSFLFDANQEMLRIGYDADCGELEENHYDLLASEARTAVFLAVAKGDAPRRTWFRLGRRITSFRGHQTLLSWSGTMFEYLMPSIFMKTYAPTLLGDSLHGAVQVQQAYARELDVPWGISESSCSSRNGEMDYDYRAFGVPAVSLRRAQPGPLVVAPYASMLALMVDRRSSTDNLRLMSSRGWTGRYGFFEAVDFRSSSTGAQPQATIVRSFMAHHQGMGLLALCNALLGNPMQRRFHAEPMVAAAELLLQERIPVCALGERPPESLSSPGDSDGI